jgi:hypothetical protein
MNVTSGSYSRGELIKPAPKRLLSSFTPPKRANNGTKVRRMNTGSAAIVAPKVKGAKQEWRGEKTPHKWLNVDGAAGDSRWSRHPITPTTSNTVHKFRNRNS